MQIIKFTAAVLTAAILGWVIGTSLVKADPRRFQAVILHMPISEEGIITGVVKKFHTEDDCKTWLRIELNDLYKTRSPFSQVSTIGRCHGR
jgi:hypothetical protein